MQIFANVFKVLTKKKKRIKIKVTMGEKKINNSINPLGGQRESL